MKKRRQDRNKGVVPITISGLDADGKSFQAMAHTLDMAGNGLRVGGLRLQLHVDDIVVIQYRYRKMEFRVVWIKPVKGTNEYQAGLRTSKPGETWRV